MHQQKEARVLLSGGQSALVSPVVYRRSSGLHGSSNSHIDIRVPDQEAWNKQGQRCCRSAAEIAGTASEHLSQTVTFCLYTAIVRWTCFEWPQSAVFDALHKRRLAWWPVTAMGSQPPNAGAARSATKVAQEQLFAESAKPLAFHRLNRRAAVRVSATVVRTRSGETG
ncbi:hypothetical protein [Leisingera sp. M523]|uniref:hypothetical protein n=1 Tax=Leisingera sp. M523 TaxID=2867013 RepID=UPI0021A46BAB|nr:hypothetical protein [Leisingera sp. M523]UWQ27838.1 hypothetical protein K3557_13730 [Leisingera sp. M523]